MKTMLGNGSGTTGAAVSAAADAANPLRPSTATIADRMAEENGLVTAELMDGEGFGNALRKVRGDVS